MSPFSREMQRVDPYIPFGKWNIYTIGYYYTGEPE